MLIVNIFHVSSLLIVAITFFIWQLGNLCETKRARVKLYLVSAWVVSAIVLLSSFIAIEIGG